MDFEFNIRHIHKTFVKQHGEFFCGLACLASIVRFHGGETTQEKLREISGTTRNGTTMLGLYQAAQKCGFEAGGFRAELRNLKEISYPVILHIVKENNLDHFVVCYGFKDNMFLIGDPASGLSKYTEEKLKVIWKSSILLHLIPGKGFVTKKQEKRRKRTWFFKLIKEDYPVLGIAAFLGVLISVFGLATALFSQRLIDQILPEKDIRTLVVGLILFFLILFVRAYLNYIREIFLVRQAKDMNFRLISGFFAKLIFIPKSFFDSISTGDMVARMNDARRIQRVVISLTSQIVIDLLILFVSAGYIFFYSVSSGLLSISSIPLFGFLAWRYNAKIIDGNREVMHSYSASESKFIDTITGIRTIKAFNCEKMFIRIFSGVYHFFMNKVFSLGLLGARISFWYSVVSAILLAVIIGWNSYLVLRDQLTIGQMMAIITLIGNLVSSAGSIAMANIQFQEARVAFDRMYEFTAIEPEYPNSRKNGKTGFSGIQRISVRNLRFRFPGRSLLLNDMKFEVSKGEIAVLFGAIGCGKSTIMAVLQRFYGYESGTITVDGFDWSEIPTDGWRDKVAAVEQHLRFFSGTLLENISLQEHPDPAKVIEYCRHYGFHDFFVEFPQGYATLVNENSTNLSGGQQQLIALARALYRRPQLLLLDEATSAMDRKTEHFVIGLLQRIKSDTAVLMVTHRPQLARHADTIVVIENQTVSACGKHQELYKTNLFYRASFEEIIA